MKEKSMEAARRVASNITMRSSGGIAHACAREILNMTSPTSKFPHEQRKDKALEIVTNGLESAEGVDQNELSRLRYAIISGIFPP